ncbi:glutathione S-transferase family protein [Halomonas rhizosphaerae]|uniref:Glutathione S-transferase family protein n=1 Tax=Halomonas rhizosphaerae TaxID=3043296 RepID=A0ABT6V3K7_9GAMM|nr:glutathione S-transferase family protein [Halomonas rhizosphaerae]MDI5892810.1 glutathione S-transferase family protein [Halomonas rhizosphaerae]
MDLDTDTGTLPDYRLYGSPDSANLVVRMVLESEGIPYREERVDRAAGGLDAPAFRRLNPQGLLPVLVEERHGTALFETGAILLHLAERCHGARFGEPAGRGRLLAWLFFLSNTVHAELRLCFYTPRYAPRAGDAQRLREALRPRMVAHLMQLESLCEHGRGPWLLEDGPSVLDPYLACLVRWMQLYPVDDPCRALPWERLPKLVGLLEALAERPGIRRAANAEGIVGRLFIAPDYPALDLRGVTG